MVSGRYDPMIGFRDVHVMTSQLTMFGLWKRVNSRLHTVGHSRKTSPMRPCALPMLGGWDIEQNISYPSQLRQYAAVDILVLVSTMSSKIPSSTARTAHASPQPLLLRMLSIPVASLGRHEGRRRGGAGYEWIQSTPCWIRRVKVIGIPKSVRYPPK